MVAISARVAREILQNSGILVSQLNPDCIVEAVDHLLQSYLITKNSSERSSHTYLLLAPPSQFFQNSVKNLCGNNIYSVIDRLQKYS